MNATGVLMVVGVVLTIALVPACIGWRFARHKDRVMAVGFFAIAGLIAAGSLGQMFVVRTINDRHIARLITEAERAKIVGRDYAYVVEALGAPSHVRHERPATIVEADKTIRVGGEPYTALEYTTTAYLLRSPNFLVILGPDGRVKNFRYND